MTSSEEERSLNLSMALRRLWKYARRYWLYFVATIAAAIILNFASLLRPYLLKILTDRVLTGGSLDGKMTLLFALLAGLLGATLVKGLFTYIQGVTMARASQGTIRDLREDVYSHLQVLPVSWYDRHRVGDILVRFTDDLRGTTELMSSGFNVLSNDTIILATSLSWMIAKDWKLTIVGMVVTPLAGMIVRRFSKRVTQATENAQEVLSNLSSHVQETVSGIKVVKAFSKEEYEGDRFSHHNRESFRWAMRIVQYTATQSPIVEVLATSGIAIVLWYCATNVILGELTLGDLLAFWAYMLMATTPINRLPQNLTNVQRGCTALGRLLALRDAASEEEVASQARAARGMSDMAVVDLPPVSGRIDIKGLRFRYQEDREEALRGIDLSIRPGEHVAIVGRNGAGKSTLVNLIPRYYEVQEGEIRLDGFSIQNVTLSSLRSQIGIVAQDTYLFSGTIGSNIAYGKEGATQDEIEAAARAAGAHDFIAQSPDGYDTYVGERGSGLSGGQRQRVALARMLLRNPPIVILDEATASMDPESERALHESMETVTRGRTVLSIAHRLIASRGADRIIVLEDGRVVEEGPHAELLEKKGAYWRLHSSLMGVEGVA